MYRLHGLSKTIVCDRDPRFTADFFKVSRDTFISHENANFLFSVVRMVQGEAKTPKIMGCCRANFAFLPALKIGTFVENEH